MAAIAATRTILGNSNNDNGPAVVFEWLNVTENDTFAAIEMTVLPDRTVQIDGTFGGATVKLQGSIDGATYFDLTDPQGNAISKTAAGGEAVTELVRYVKPTASEGSSQAVNVRLLCSGGRR